MDNQSRITAKGCRCFQATPKFMTCVKLDKSTRSQRYIVGEMVKKILNISNITWGRAYPDNILSENSRVRFWFIVDE